MRRQSQRIGLIWALAGGLILGPLSVYGQGKASSNICEDKAAQALLTSSKNQHPLEVLRTPIGTSDVILIGEIHFSLPGLRGKLIEQMGKSLRKGSCLLYELNEKKTISQHLKHFRQPYYEDNLRQFEEIHRAARKLSLREHTVDRPSGLAALDDLDPRDAAMMANIVSLHRSGRCAQSLMFVGKSHMTAETAERKTLSQLLRRSGLKVLTLNLQDVNDDAEPFDAELSSWNGVCPTGRQLPRPSEPTVFRSADLPKRLLFYPLSSSAERWTDFEWTILARP